MSKELKNEISKLGGKRCGVERVEMGGLGRGEYVQTILYEILKGKRRKTLWLYFRVPMNLIWAVFSPQLLAIGRAWPPQTLLISPFSPVSYASKINSFNI